MATTSPRSLQNSVTTAYNEARESVESMKSDVEAASREVEKELGRMRKAVIRVAKENPAAAAGVLLGTGALVGAVLHRVLAPPPTPGQIILQALKRRGLQTGAALATGYQLARRAMK